MAEGDRKYKIVLKEGEELIIVGNVAKIEESAPGEGSWIRIVDEDGNILFGAESRMVRYFHRVEE